MCGGCAPATGINSPPEGGVHGPPARFACAVPAAPRALPGRGLAPPDPQGCAPGAPSRTGPLLPRSPSRRGSGHGCDGGGGGQPLAVVHARRPAPWRFSGFRRNSVVGRADARRGFGGVPPVVGRRWATRPRRWAARVQPQAVPAVHGLGEVVHGRPGSGRSGSSEQSNRANIFSFAQPTRAKPRQYWVSREPLYKKIGDPDCTTLCNLTTEMQSKQQFSTF